MRRSSMQVPRLWPAVVVVVSWVSLTPAEEFSGKVVGVSDGDTIRVLRSRTPIEGSPSRHRLPRDRPGLREPCQSVHLGARLRSGREGRASGHRPLRANRGRCHPRRWPHPQSRAGAGGPRLAVPEVCSGDRYARPTRSSSTRREAGPVVTAEPRPAVGLAKEQGRSPARGAGREVPREPANPRLSQAGLPVANGPKTTLSHRGSLAAAQNSGFDRGSVNGTEDDLPS